MSARQGIHTDDLEAPPTVRDALVAAHDALTAVERNDLTERYGYSPDEGPIANRDGQTPPAGRRWFTPREVAAQAKRDIEAALGLPGPPALPSQVVGPLGLACPECGAYVPVSEAA